MSAPASLIAFCGPKGAGKTTAADLLCRFGGPDWGRYAFADPIRDLLEVLGVTREQSSSPATKEQPIAHLGGHTPRQLMVSLGTTWGRQMVDENIWLNQAAWRIARLRSGLGVEAVVIDDLRFDNEAALIADLGGTIYEIERPGYSYDPAQPTEAGITRGYITEVIRGETPQDLAKAMARILSNYS